MHVGFGDRDLDLHRTDPMLLLPLLRTMTPVPVLLLHCYPFQRQAGYLAQAFDHVNFDVGLAINYLGARSTGLVAEALETAPFAKQLYSSDAFGPPELHVLGSVLWRRAMGLVLGEWVRAGDCTERRRHPDRRHDRRTQRRAGVRALMHSDRTAFRRAEAFRRA